MDSNDAFLPRPDLVAYSPQNPVICEGTMRDNVLLGHRILHYQIHHEHLATGRKAVLKHAHQPAAAAHLQHTQADAAAALARVQATVYAARA